ncbi:unnamed protein product [Ectocarpus sp. CCAP 1310/34]|nr:unnamed protein product [Ectocarpus sp. CCAP 1310/34]
MSDDRLPAMVDKAAWGKATSGKKGIRWDRVVVWEELGDEEETLDTEGFGGFKKKVKEMLESREEATLRKKFTFGFSKLPTPAQIRASLADADQLGADDLRRKIRNYSLSRAAPEVSDFLKACIGRETVEEYLELQAVTAAIVDRFVVEGGEQEMDISQACRKRVLESELARYNIFDEAITEVLSVMEVDFKADVHRWTSCQRLLQEGKQPPALSKPDSGERPVSGGRAVGTWRPQPPGFGNQVTGRQQVERRKEEVVVSSPGTGRRVVGGPADVGGRGSGSRLEGRASLGGDADCDDDDDDDGDGEAGVRLERHRDVEDVGGAGRPTSPVRREKREPRPRLSTDDAAPGMAPAAAAGGGSPRREGNRGGVDSRSIVLTPHLRELSIQIGSPSATTPTGCVLSPRLSCSADVSAGDGAKASPRSTPAAAVAAPPPPSWGRRDSETGGGADWRYETPPRRPHKPGQGGGRRGGAMPGRARPGGRRVATGILKDREGGGGGGGGGGSASGKEGRGRGTGAKALAEDEGDENGDRSTRTTTADTTVSSDAERGGGRDPLLLPRQAAGGGGVAAEPGRGGIGFLVASSSATTEPGAPAVASTPMAPTAVCDRSTFTPATAAARPKSSKTSSRFVSPSRIARFFGGRELWRWSRGGSVAGVESFSDGAGDADADAAATKGDAGISAPCAEDVGVASLIARGDSSWSPARWYTPSSSAASSSAALGRSPAAAFSPATAAAAAARGGGAKRHHHLARPLSKKDPETTLPSSRAADIVQTPPMPPLPQRPVPRQWTNSHILLEKPGGGGVEESPVAKVAADGDDKAGGAATPVPPASQAGAAAAAAATDAVGTRHDAERDRRAASSPPEDRSTAGEEDGTGGWERATPPSSPSSLQEVVKSRLNSSFNTTASSLGSESSDYYTRLRSFASLLVGCGGGSDKSVSETPSLVSVPLAVPVPAGGECPSGPPPQDKPKPSSVDVPLAFFDATPSEAKREEEAVEQTAQDRSPSRGSAREAGRASATGHGHSKTCGGGGGGGGGEQESSGAPSAVPNDRATSPTQASSLRGTTPLTSPVRVPPTLWSSPSASSRREDNAAAGSYPSPFENAGCRRRGEEAAQEGARVSAEGAALMTAPSFSSAASEESRLSSQPPETSGERCPAAAFGEGTAAALVLWPSSSSSSASGTSRQLFAGTTVGDSGLVVVGETVAPSSPAAAMAMVAVEDSPLMREEQQWQRQPGPLSPRLLGEQQQQQQQRKERHRRQQSFLASLDRRDGKGSTPSPVKDSSWHHQGQREHQGPLPSRPRGEGEPATTPTKSGGTPERELGPSGGVAMPFSSSPDPPGRVELGSSCGNSSLNNSTNASSILSGSSEYYTRLRSFAALAGGGGGGDPDSHLDGSTRSSTTAGSAVPQSSPLRPFGCNETRSRAASSPASGSSSDTAQPRGSTSSHALLPPGPNESMSMPSSLSSTPPPPCRPFDAEAGSETGSSLSLSLSQALAPAPYETQLTAEPLGMVGTTMTPKQRTALESNILSFLGVRSGGDGGGGLFRGEPFFEDDDVLSRRLGGEERQRDGAGTGAAAAARARAGFDAEEEPPLSPVHANCSRSPFSR